MKCLAVIPARSGSKGLPHKNIMLLCGKPLVAHTIQAALDSGCFEEVMVSTDSVEYAEIARQYGAEVPFLRRSETSTDQASSWDVVLEVLAQYEQLGKSFTHVCLLQPTSPLRTAQDIQGAFSMINNAKSVVGVCPAEHSPLLCAPLPASGSMEAFLQPKANGPRQNYEQFYRLNGAIYLTECDFLRENCFLYRPGCYAYVMEKSHSVDIDTMEDMVIAKALLQWNHGAEGIC